MKIAIDLTALNDNFSGIERYALNMTLALLEQDKKSEYELVFKNEVFPAFLSYQKNARIHMHILKGCRKLLFNQFRLPGFLNRLDADCFLFLAFPAPVFLYRRHVFGTIHDLCCFDCSWTMKRQMAWYFRLSYLCMAKKAERIITISKFSRGRIQEILHVPEERILVAYCGISEEFLRRDSQHEGQNRFVVYGQNNRSDEIRTRYGLPETYYLCLSTLEPRKNMLLLLQAYLELWRQGQVRTKLVLAGRKGWKIDDLLAKADAADAGQVIVTGFIEEADLPEVYRMAKCFLFPSLYEGFGIPPLEAMSQGVPVLASDGSSLPEVLGDAAMYFENDKIESLRKAILSLEGQSEEERKRYIQAGKARSAQFRYDKEAEKILQSIYSLAGNS